MTEPEPIPIPTKLSEAMFLAIRDANALDRSIYFPNSGQWHHQQGQQGLCHVCIAGTIIARRFCERYEHIGIGGLEKTDFPEQWRLVFEALDDARQGRYTEAIETIMGNNNGEGINIPNQIYFAPPPAFSGFRGWNDFDIFLSDFKAMANYLQERGF